jgi:methylated-DNA-[protein]-cysteine S-methyltransferase
LKYTVFNTGIGWIGLLGSSAGLLQATLPQPSHDEAFGMLGGRTNQASLSSEPFDDLVERLRSYFSGHRTTFPDNLDLSEATPFQREVWQVLRLIPYGETRSYAWVAESIEKPGAARAVGQAVGKNPLAIIIPCHRVIASDGTLGGFGGGLELKRHLLHLEGNSLVG